jgi:ABC-2 type transport system permease protein
VYSAIDAKQLTAPGGRAISSDFAKAFAFIAKDMRISVSYKLQFFFQFVQIFFSVTLIYFVGKMLSREGQAVMLKDYRADYFAFALVGLSISSYLRAGLVTLTNDIRQTMNQGTLEAMCAAPINYTWLLFCSSLWHFIFETVRVLFYFLLAILVFGMRLTHVNWPGVVLTLILTAPIFLMLGVISCSILILVKRGDPINWIFSGLSGLLAGTIFHISVLPGWLQRIAWCLPLTHSLEAMRRCLLAGDGISRISVHLAALLGFIVALVPLTIAANTLCMRKAKSRGAFATH